MSLLKAAVIRAVRTAIQTFIALCSTTALITQVDWKIVISSVAMASLISFLQAILLGLPEAAEEDA